jgi:hypothetical protein
MYLSWNDQKYYRVCAACEEADALKAGLTVSLPVSAAIKKKE